MRVLFVLMGGLFASLVCGQTREEVLYQELNLFRKDPLQYSQSNGFRLECTPPIDPSYEQLRVEHNLERSAQFHASTMASWECPVISHETCPAYCHLFHDSCSYEDRIRAFLEPTPSSNINEILIKGPKNPRRIMELFLGSKGHCNHMLDKNINSMGANYTHLQKSVFVVDFAKINTTSRS